MKFEGTELDSLSSKKILILAWRDLDDLEAGGSEVHAHELAKRFSQFSLDVTVRTSVAFGRPKIVERDGYQVVRKAGRYMVFPRSIASCFFRLDPKKYVVLEVWNGVPFFTPLWFRGPKAVFIHHIHGQMWQMMFPKYLAALGNAIEEKVAPRFYRGIQIMTASQSSKEELISRMGFNECDITVIRPGVDPQFFRNGKKSKDPLILAVGRLAPVKRFSLFIDLVSELKKEIPNLKAMLVGDGYERDYLRFLINERDANSYISLEGRLNFKDLLQAYSKAWVLVSTSLREGWGLTISEAAAAKTPAVATDIVGHRDSIIHGKNGFLARDFDELKSYCTALIEDDELRSTFGRNAQQEAKKLSWDLAATSALNVLNKAVKNRG